MYAPTVTVVIDGILDFVSLFYSAGTLAAAVVGEYFVRCQCRLNGFCTFEGRWAKARRVIDGPAGREDPGTAVP